ncbi:MAG: hypothetical protein AB8G95_17400 [Anaerolineae bacterium]
MNSKNNGKRIVAIGLVIGIIALGFLAGPRIFEIFLEMHGL